MRFILVRHGEIDSNIRKIYSGRSQERLNANGITQAGNVARSLKSASISALFCGPLPRVVETARYISTEIGVKPVLLEAFNELAMGPWEGLSEDEVAERFSDDWQLWNSSPAALRLPGRETLKEMQHRALGGLADALRLTSKQGQICIVTHVAVIRVLRLFAEQRNLNEYKKVPVPNATPISIDIDEIRLPH